MRGSDTNEKIAAAGFTIVREDDYPVPRIKQWTGDSAWKTLEEFGTKAARDRRLQELLQDQKTVRL